MVKALFLALVVAMPWSVYMLAYEEEKDVLLVAAALFFGLLVLSTASEVRELLFYRQNGWDFTVDSRKNFFETYKGDSTHEDDRDSNRTRVLFKVPFLIVFLLVFFVAFLAVYISERA